MSEALERTKRSLDLIPFILEHQGISLDELAKKFNISTETLYEDLNMLFCCGLPGYTPLELIDMNFEDGYVSISNPQELDKPRKLSKTELLRLHLGLELCRKFAPVKIESRIDKLQTQISQLLSQSSPVEIVDSESEVDLKILVEALNVENYLEFDYVSANSDTVTKRKIIPIGITESMSHIYLDGIEPTGTSKTFRTDRIRNLKLGGKHPSISSTNPIVKNPVSWILKISRAAQSFLNENSQIILESHEEAEGYLVTLREVSESWLTSEVFAYGGDISVIDPPSFMARIGALARERLSNS